MQHVCSVAGQAGVGVGAAWHVGRRHVAGIAVPYVQHGTPQPQPQPATRDDAALEERVHGQEWRLGFVRGAAMRALAHWGCLHHGRGRGPASHNRAAGVTQALGSTGHAPGGRGTCIHVCMRAATCKRAGCAACVRAVPRFPSSLARAPFRSARPTWSACGASRTTSCASPRASRLSARWVGGCGGRAGGRAGAWGVGRGALDGSYPEACVHAATWPWRKAHMLGAHHTRTRPPPPHTHAHILAVCLPPPCAWIAAIYSLQGVCGTVAALRGAACR